MIFDNDSLGWVRDRKTRRREAAGRKKTGQNSVRDEKNGTKFGWSGQNKSGGTKKISFPR